MRMRSFIFLATLSVATKNLFGVSDMVEDMGPPSAATMMQVSSDAQAFDVPDQAAMAMTMDVAQTQGDIDIEPTTEDKTVDRTYDAAQLGAEMDKKNGGSGPLAPQMAQGTPSLPGGTKLVPVTKNKKRAQEVMQQIFPAGPKPLPEIPECIPPLDQPIKEEDSVEKPKF